MRVGERVHNANGEVSTVKDNGSRTLLSAWRLITL